MNITVWGNFKKNFLGMFCLIYVYCILVEKAKEKEERYAKRAQRRAELEAKRKEREEEKARLGGGRKKSQDKRVDESFEKGNWMDAYN